MSRKFLSVSYAILYEVCADFVYVTRHGRCTWSRKPDSGASPQAVTTIAWNSHVCKAR